MHKGPKTFESLEELAILLGLKNAQKVDIFLTQNEDELYSRLITSQKRSQPAPGTTATLPSYPNRPFGSQAVLDGIENLTIVSPVNSPEKTATTTTKQPSTSAAKKILF